MSIQTPKLEHKPDAIQIVIDFNAAEKLLSERKDTMKTVEELNTKYPYAKLNPNVVEYKGSGVYFISGNEMNLKGLEEYVSSLNDTYKPEENEDWHNK